VSWFLLFEEWIVNVIFIKSSSLPEIWFASFDFGFFPGFSCFWTIGKWEHEFSSVTDKGELIDDSSRNTKHANNQNPNNNTSE